MNKQERNRIKQILVIMVLGWFLILGFNYLIELPGSKADQLCPITGTVHGTVTLQPENGNNVIDCSTQDIVIASDGELVVERYYTANGSRDGDGGAILLARNITIDEGGRITATGKGYRAGETDNGTGNAVASTDNVGGSGGGYGGAGGEGQSNGPTLPGTTGKAYGDEQSPGLLGGAGGSTGNLPGANGGGSIKIVVGQTFTLNGIIEANGNNGTASTDNSTSRSSGGGAGGSVWITADILAGNGSVSADGGDAPLATFTGGGGGGGRVLMECVYQNDFSGDLSVAPGDGAQDGQYGSIVGAGCRPNDPTISKVFEGSGLGTRELTTGSLTTYNSITFATDLISNEADADLRLQIELREVGQSFQNVPTNTEGTFENNPQNCSNPINDCGNLTVNNLGTGKRYKWQARVVSSVGLQSSWLDVGNNGDDPDFTISGPAVGFAMLQGNNQTGIVGTDLDQELGARLVDANGFGLAFTAVNWQILTGGGSVPSLSGITDAEGNVYSKWRMGTVAGTNNNTIRLSKVNLGSTLTFTASAQAGPVARYVVSVPSMSLINTNFNINIQALDAFNNTTPINSNVSLSAVLVDGTTAGSGVLGPSQATLVNGTVLLTNGTYDTSEVIKVKVLDAGNVSGLSNSILIASTLGSCPTIDVDTNQTWDAATVPNGIFDCRGLGTLTIHSGITLSLKSKDNGDSNWGNDYGVTILADAMDLQSTGVISADSLGYGWTRGPGNPYLQMHQGASHGGYGAYNSKEPYGDVYEPSMLGSSAGNADRGATGGGSIKLVIDGTSTINGTISANGSDAQAGWAGGASGGSIWIDTNTLAGNGLIRSNGGRADQNGGGSGGRIALYYATNLDNEFQLTPAHLQSIGNNGGWGGNYGGPGTVYIENKGVDTSRNGILMANNNGNNSYAAGLVSGSYSFKQINQTSYGHIRLLGQTSILSVSDGASLVGDATKPSLTVDGTFLYLGSSQLFVNGVDVGFNGEIAGVTDFTVGNTLAGGVTLYAKTWAHDNTNQYAFNEINVGSSGSLTLVSNDNGNNVWTDDYGVNLQVLNLTVNTGGLITADSRGYGWTRGPGNPNLQMHQGAAHGGYGANSGVSPYGDVYEPVMLGSSAGNADRGATGGGSMKIEVTQRLTLDGTISANGSNAQAGWAGGASGGSIFIVTNQIAGNGLIRSNGGKADQNGGGSGGRIALYYSENYNESFTFNPTHLQTLGSNGGWGGNWGASGTVYIEKLGVDPVKGGKLIVDNGGNNGAAAGLVSGVYQFEQISITRYGHLTVLGQASQLIVPNGNVLVGDSTKPNMRVEGTINYTSIDTLAINGVNLVVAGEIVGVNDINIGQSLAAGLTLNARTWAHNLNNQYYFNTIRVAPNGLLYLVGYDNGDTNWTNDYGVTLNLTDLTIDTGGLVSADATGYGWTRGPGNPNLQMGQGAAHGGYGANSGVAPYGDPYEPWMFGSSAGNAERGATGGGSIKLVINNTLTNNGTISANGSDAQAGWAGGASGGSIWIDTENISGAGVIRSNGGRADQNGGGSGGRIAIYYTQNKAPNYEFIPAHVQTFGNNGGWGGNWGASGTVYIEQKGVDQVKGGKLFVDNNSNNGAAAGLISGNYLFNTISMTRYGHLKVLGQASMLTVTDGAALIGDATRSSLTVEGTLNYTGEGALYVNGVDLGIAGDITGVDDFTLGNNLSGGMTFYANTWAHNKENGYSFQNAIVGPFGIITFVPYNNGDSNYTNDYGVNIEFNNLDLQTGGRLNSDALGYPSHVGPGIGTDPGDWRRGAGGYGGYGSGTGAAIGGSPYGSVYLPRDLGSGGRGDSVPGGGVIEISVLSKLTINGDISANGRSGSAHAGGSSGGSILITTNEIEGNGTVRTNGGNGDGNGGGGGGGRIALYYSTNINFPLDGDHLQSRGGQGGWVPSLYGGPGTVYIEQVGVDENYGAQLYIDNYSRNNGTQAGLTEGNYKFETINLVRNGNLKVMGQSSNIEITSEEAIIGDASRPSFVIEGTLNYTGGGTFRVNGFDLGLAGDTTGITDFTIGDELQGGLTLYAQTWVHNKDLPYSFGNLRVGPLGLITLIPYQNGDSNYTNDYGVKLNLAGLTIDNGGIIQTNGRGYPAHLGPGIGTDPGDWKRGAASYGGYGSESPATPGTPYGSLYLPRDLGSGGRGDNVPGGGALEFNISGDTLINGRIEANGTPGSGHAGGSSGGSILIFTNSIDGTGLVQANGSAGDGQGGGGSGGRIAIYYAQNNGFDFSASAQARGGLGGSWNPEKTGGPGTIYHEDSSSDREYGGSLIINNAPYTGRAMNFAAQQWNFANVTIGENITTWVQSDIQNNRGVVFDLTGDFSLGNNSRILGNGRGYPSSEGTGKGEDGVLQNGGGGGANGGNGGNGESSDGSTQTFGGEKYGDQFFPYTLGSGGGKGGIEAEGMPAALGGTGGGAFAVISESGDIEVLGDISMNGTNGSVGSPGGGGGAGGSILLYSNSCSVVGDVTAEGGDGGDGTFDGGGGGGGRISLIKVYGECDVLGEISVAMGDSLSGQVGQVGTYAGVVTLPQIELENQSKLTGEIIPVGGVISDNQVRFEVGVSDPGATELEPKNLVVDIEVVETSGSFSENVLGLTSISSDVINFTGGDAQGVTLTLSSGLTIGEDYKWRGRVRNVDEGIISNWIEFGDNANAPDFSISSTQSFGVEVDKTEVEIGETIGITVSALDGDSVVVPNYLGTVTFSYSPLSDPGPNLPSNYTFSAGDSGVHTFSGELMFFSPGDYQVMVTDINNPAITGTSAWITVLAPPATPTPTPTETPIPTLTPTGGTGDETTPTPSPTTDNVLVSVTPTTMDEEEERDCFEDPLQPKCQVNVVISNVRVTVDNEALTSEICFDTNISTIGVIKYGTESYTESSDVEKTYRLKNHCITFDNLASAMGYIYKIEAVSYAGKRGSYEGTFVTEGGVPPVIVEPKECIVINSTSFTDDHRVVLDYETSGPALCQVSYGSLGNEFSEILPKDSEELIKHRSYMELIKVEPYTDLMYRILCEVKDGDKVNSCEIMDVISWNKIKTYYPEDGYRTWQSTELVGRIGEGLPFIGISFLGMLLVANLFAFPQLPLYGLFILKRRKKGSPWGIVYDKEKKIPVSFAVLRLYDTAGKLIEQSVSSLDGKYGFIVDKANYRLEIAHSEYSSTMKDINIQNDGDILSENIPLTRKANVLVSLTSLKNNIASLNRYLIFIGLALSIIAFMIRPELLNAVILLLYLIQFVYLMRSNNRYFGSVFSESEIKGIQGAFVRLFDVNQGRQLEVAMTDKKGRYRLLADPGQYLLKVDLDGFRMADQNGLVNKFGENFIELRNDKGYITRNVVLKRSA